MTMVVKMLGIWGNSAKLITSTCQRLIYPCQTNFTVKMIINAILCHFTCFF